MDDDLDSGSSLPQSAGARLCRQEDELPRAADSGAGRVPGALAATPVPGPGRESGLTACFRILHTAPLWGRRSHSNSMTSIPLLLLLPQRHRCMRSGPARVDSLLSFRGQECDSFITRFGVRSPGPSSDIAPQRRSSFTIAPAETKGMICEFAPCLARYQLREPYQLRGEHRESEHPPQRDGDTPQGCHGSPPSLGEGLDRTTPLPPESHTPPVSPALPQMPARSQSVFIFSDDL